MSVIEVLLNVPLALSVISLFRAVIVTEKSIKLPPNVDNCDVIPQSVKCSLSQILLIFKDMEKELKLLGRRIATIRNARGLTQEKLAEMVQRSPNHISKLEIAGTNPSFELLVQLAKALDVELYELFNFFG